MIAYDLHVHTTASDGTYSPREICALAGKRRLKGLAITDHDTVAAYAQLTPEDTQGLTLVPGVEINTEYGGQEVHVLGYGVDLQAERFLEAITRLQEQRRIRCRQMVEKLRQTGINLDWEQVQELIGDSVPGRPHVGLALLRGGYVSSVREAMQKYLTKGRPAYVPRYEILPAQALDIIRSAGGVTVLAHPGLIEDAAVLAQVLDLPLDGLEVYYPLHDAATTEHFKQLARRSGRLITGGSDFHGLVKNEEPEHLGSVGLDQKNFIKFFNSLKGNRISL
jgi:predicted metal-dependent phosphoesterase TrpH